MQVNEAGPHMKFDGSFRRGRLSPFWLVHPRNDRIGAWVACDSRWPSRRLSINYFVGMPMNGASSLHFLMTVSELPPSSCRDDMILKLPCLP